MANTGKTKKETTQEVLVVSVKNEINKQLGDKETFTSLLTTTFKGLDGATAKRAMMEGMLRGYKFTDFLQKNVYAIPFKEGYSLVTSIDYARKLGMRSGVVGKSAPTFEMDNAKIISCTVTIKRKVGEYVGDFTATVYFDEYTTGRNLWGSKPRTMIAKVAEMHALRMACPEEMSQLYTEEEFDKSVEDGVVYDTEEIPDDAVVISTGDDTPGIDEAPVVHIINKCSKEKCGRVLTPSESEISFATVGKLLCEKHLKAFKK